MCLDDRLAHGLERCVAFRALALRHDDSRAFEPGGFQRGFGGAKMAPGDGRVGDDRTFGARAERRDALAQAREQPAADDDVVAARAERDLDHGRLSPFALAQRRGHGLLSAISSGLASLAMISSTMLSCGSSRDCTTMSESA